MRARKLAVLIGAVAIIAAGCGSSGSSGSKASGSTTTTAAAATGAPVVFGTVSNDTAASNSPQGADGVEIGAAYVNAHGGLDGRPVQIKRCDEAGDAAKHQACVRGFIDDPSVVGLVYGIARQVTTGLPLIAQANMPSIFPTPVVGTELASPVGFAVTGGTAVSLAVLAHHYAQEGKKKVTFLAVNVASIPPIIAQMNTIMQQNGLPNVQQVLYPATTTDFAPTATAAMAQNPDAIFMITSPATFATAVKALRDAGYTGEISAPSTVMTSTAIAALGSSADGIFTETDFPSANDAKTAAEKAIFTAYNQGLSQKGEAAAATSFNGFMAMLVLQKMVDSIGVKNLTRQSLLNFIKTGTVTGLPLLPTLTLKNAPSGPQFQAMANPTGYLAEVKGGQIVTVGSRFTFK